jgi:hypothetical protein
MRVRPIALICALAALIVAAPAAAADDWLGESTGIATPRESFL